MDITIHLEDEQARKLKYIQQHTNQPAADVLNRAVQEAIESQYQELQTISKSALERFHEFGLVGSMDSDHGLPASDNPSIQDYLNEKREQGRL